MKQFSLVLGCVLGRVFVLGLAVIAATAVAAKRAEAQTYPWCANFADGAGTNCGFSTLEQCMATARGSGGFCDQNNLYKPPAGSAAPAAPARHKAHRHPANQNPS